MLKLMIVDDEPIILSGIKDMVEKGKTAFSKIVTAGDGIEALEIMDYFHPDLIITDIQMPEMNGLDFIAKAKAKNGKRFVVLSGYDVFEYAQHAIRLQVADYLLKPIHERQLIELLKRMAIEVMEQHQQDNLALNVEEEAEASLSDHVKMLKEFIHNKYTKDISLSDAAEYLNLHPAYLGQLFRKETGDSFVHYINHVRIEKAKELLAAGLHLPLEIIAESIGFENSRTFYKVFRKHVGLTPGQYRNNNQQS
jgi:YesN/AraC family two-component response regulator